MEIKVRTETFWLLFWIKKISDVGVSPGSSFNIFIKPTLVPVTDELLRLYRVIFLNWVCTWNTMKYKWGSILVNFTWTVDFKSIKLLYISLSSYVIDLFNGIIIVVFTSAKSWNYLFITLFSSLIFFLGQKH